MEPVYVARNPHEKAMQRALIQYRDPKNYDLVKEALLLEHREDLIGYGRECLIPPRKPKEGGKRSGSSKHSKRRRSVRGTPTTARERGTTGRERRKRPSAMFTGKRRGNSEMKKVEIREQI